MSEGAVGAVVLAAGASSRMGEPKQLLRLGGETLLRRALRAAFEGGCRPVVVVLGARAEELRAEAVWGGAHVVFNEAWAEGMGSSIRCGLGALLDATGEALLEAAVLMLCDQPFVDGEVIGRLVETYRAGGARLVASRYGVEGARGVPALFDCTLFPELLELDGAEGAKGVIKRHACEAAYVAAPAAAFDVDTPDDYRALKRIEAR